MSYTLSANHLTTFDDRQDRNIAKEFIDCMGESGEPVGLELLIEHDRSRTKPFNNPALHDFRMMGGVWTDPMGWEFDRRDRRRCRNSKGSIGMIWYHGQFHVPGRAFAKDGRVESDILVTAGRFEGGVAGFGVIAPTATLASPQYFTGIITCPCKEAHALTARPSIVISPTTNGTWLKPDTNLIQLRRNMMGELEYGMMLPLARDRRAVVGIAPDPKVVAELQAYLDKLKLVTGNPMAEKEYLDLIDQGRRLTYAFPAPKYTPAMEAFSKVFLDTELDPDVSIFED